MVRASIVMNNILSRLGRAFHQLLSLTIDVSRDIVRRKEHSRAFNHSHITSGTATACLEHPQIYTDVHLLRVGLPRRASDLHNNHPLSTKQIYFTTTITHLIAHIIPDISLLSGWRLQTSGR
jgi:hypothetical protein